MRDSRESFEQPTRRRVLQGAAALGAGLVVGFRWTPRGRTAHASAAGAAAFAPNAFVRVAPDGTVTILSKHIEFGQGTYTGLATIVADEMDADWSTVRVESAPADAERYANLAFGVQGTGGSTAMANSWMQMRKAGATARALLVAAAAERWGVPAGEIEVEAGTVRHKGSGESAGFGELAEAAAQLEPPADVPLKDPSEFTLIGTDPKRVDIAAKTEATAVFTQDFTRPGMLTALVARPPRFGGKVARFDATAARKVPGVAAVVEIPTGVAVLAQGFWAAKKGRDALTIEWDDSAAETRGSAELLAEYRSKLGQPGAPARQDGDAASALEMAVHNNGTVLEAEFEFPYLAHAPMETLDCVIERKGADPGAAGCTVWAGSQLQTVDQGAIAGILGLQPQQVTLHTLLGGGSFGRRATPNADVAAEAAHVAKALDDTDLDPATPIKLVWTREDDIRGGRYRPLAVHRLRATLDGDGLPLAWEHRIVTQSIVKGTPFEAALVQNGIDGTSVEGARGLPYAIPNLQVELHTAEVGVPVLWWRSVGHTHNGYATEVFLDQLAHAAGRDPVELRRQLLAEHPRHLGVLDLAAEKAGWGKKLPDGRARGVAVHESFSSYVAQVVEVSVQEGPDGLPWPKVHRVVCAVDCGVAINPGIIRAQMESGIGYGLGAALYNEIVLEGGRVRESNFHNYRPLRIHDMPAVEVHVVPSTEDPTGVGEPGVPPIAPAVANAYFQLTGRWLHRLPFRRALEEAASEEVS